MAYGDYGAFVYCNGERRADHEDAVAFGLKPDYFGDWLHHPHHGILGEGPIQVICHKQGLPEIYEQDADGTIKEIKYCDDNVDSFDYNRIEFEYKGYKFEFTSYGPYMATMTEPDGAVWYCEYDYGIDNTQEDDE